ncbi:unnamed protein product [Prunus brigantina]
MKHERWEKANRIYMLIMKKSMIEATCGGIPDSDTAKEYLEAVGEKFKESNKAETGNLMNKLATMKYDGVDDMRVYLLGMIETANKLKALDMNSHSRSFYGSHCFELPSFTIWTTQGDLQCSKGQVGSHELILVCVQNEAPIKKEKEVNTVHLNTNAPKRHFFKPS